MIIIKRKGSQQEGYFYLEILEIILVYFQEQLLLTPFKNETNHFGFILHSTLTTLNSEYTTLKSNILHYSVTIYYTITTLNINYILTSK